MMITEKRAFKSDVPLIIKKNETSFRKNLRIIMILGFLIGPLTNTITKEITNMPNRYIKIGNLKQSK